MKTFSAKAEQIQRRWWVVDAKDQILGNVAVQVANLLRGKNKTIFTPNVDSGDYVVVINAKEVRLTGNKESDKVYTSHSGYIGGQKRESPKSIRARNRPERLVEMAIRGLIPHNSLGRKIYTKLRVIAGETHSFANHKPEAYQLS